MKIKFLILTTLISSNIQTKAQTNEMHPVDGNSFKEIKLLPEINLQLGSFSNLSGLLSLNAANTIVLDSKRKVFEVDTSIKCFSSIASNK